MWFLPKAGGRVSLGQTAPFESPGAQSSWGWGRRDRRGSAQTRRPPPPPSPGLGLQGAGRGWSQPWGAPRFPHLLWLFSSSDLAQKARISKSTPQASGGEKVTSYTRPLTPPRPSFPLPSPWSGTLAPSQSGLRSVGPGVRALSPKDPVAGRASVLSVQGEPLYSPGGAWRHHEQINCVSPGDTPHPGFSLTAPPRCVPGSCWSPFCPLNPRTHSRRTFPVSSGPGCRVTEQGRFWGICGEARGGFSSPREPPNLSPHPH